MSLYFGKDNSGKNILHMTAQTVDSNTMKSGRHSSTFFLTSENNYYFTVDRFPITFRTSSFNHSLAGRAGGNTLGWYKLVVSYPYTGDVWDKFTFTSSLDTSSSSLVSEAKINGDVIFFIDANGQVIPSLSVYGTVFSPAGSNPDTGSSTNSIYSSTNNTLGYCISGDLSTVKALLDRVKEVVILRTKAQSALDGSIRITKNDFLIGGVSIFKNMSFGVFTNSPIGTSSNGSVNTLLPNLSITKPSSVSNITLSSNSSDSYIAIDGVKVFSKDTKFSKIGGAPITTISILQVEYSVARVNSNILDLRPYIGDSKQVIIKASAEFFISKAQTIHSDYLHLGYLILVDTPSILLSNEVGWDSEGPGGSCRGSTYIEISYANGFLRASNPKIDYRCLSNKPWWQNFILKNIEIYAL